jgi:hypothetical protein
VERRHWGYLKSDTKTFKKDEGFEMYVVMLLNLIEYKGKLFVVLSLNTIQQTILSAESN